MESIPVRAVHLPERVELHAASCGCKVPASAEVTHRDHDAADLADIHAEALDLNDGSSPVKPCLRRAASIR